MFTRCPGCSTVHPVNAALLARHGGKYRCSKCDKVSNALDALFDDWPQAGQAGAQPGTMPVLGFELDLEQARQARYDPGSEPAADHAAVSPRTPSLLSRIVLRAAWLAGGVLVGAIIIFNVAEFAGQPVLEKEEVESALVRVGLKKPAPAAEFRDLDRIHLVSRELTNDPARPGVLRLRATLVNRAAQAQPYPAIEVILNDSEGARVSARRFEAGEYLAMPPGDTPMFASQAYLPLSLELEDPGEQAVGFELKFH
jgi:predicted Zn finger-like uncharacterized protein